MRQARPRPLRDLALAVSTLTALPLRVEWPAGERTDAPGYYPLVGALLGGLGFGFARLVSLAGFSSRAPLVFGGLLIVLWAIATRGLHWDGLGDVADAFGAFDAERRLAIMRDSAIGAFGATAIALCAFVQSASVAPLMRDDRAWTLFAVPALARFAATFAAWLGTPARTDGLGASVIGRPRVGALLPAALTLAVVAGLSFVASGITGVVLIGCGMALALVVPHLIALRMGGVTGDVMGASVVLVETVLFAACAAIL